MKLRIQANDDPELFLRTHETPLIIDEFQYAPNLLSYIKINIEDKFYKEEANYSVGDFVYHEVFGQGKVLSISGSLIEIAFKHPHGIRKLMKNHKSLSKV